MGWGGGGGQKNFHDVYRKREFLLITAVCVLCLDWKIFGF